MNKEYGTDPYGHLEWAIGDELDFICFDFTWDKETNKLVLHSVVNSETSHFIEDFQKQFETVLEETNKAAQAFQLAESMVQEALDWTYDNEIEHDTLGWNQDPYYFVRSVVAEVTSNPPPMRIVDKDNQSDE